MKVVADANELFSAVISKGRGWKAKTLDIFFSDDVKLSAQFLDKLDEAKETSPHAKDIEYFALALKFESDCIWSEEARLKEQATVKVFNTDELWELLNPESEDK